MGIGPFRIGMGELLIILVVVLLIFGPKNLPKLGSALGKTVKSLREGVGGSKNIKEETEEPVEEVDEEPAKATAKKSTSSKSTARSTTTKKKTDE